VILAESVALAPETIPWASGNELTLLVDGEIDFLALMLSVVFPDACPSPVSPHSVQNHSDHSQSVGSIQGVK